MFAEYEYDYGIQGRREELGEKGMDLDMELCQCQLFHYGAQRETSLTSSSLFLEQ